MKLVYLFYTLASSEANEESTKKIPLNLADLTQEQIDEIRASKQMELANKSIKERLKQPAEESLKALQAADEYLTEIGFMMPATPDDDSILLKKYPNLADSEVFSRLYDMHMRFKTQDALEYLGPDVSKIVTDVQALFPRGEQQLIKPDGVQDTPAMGLEMNEFIMNSFLLAKTYAEKSIDESRQEPFFLEPSELVAMAKAEPVTHDKTKTMSMCNFVGKVVLKIQKVINGIAQATAVMFQGLCACIPIVNKCVLANFPYTCKWPINVHEAVFGASSATHFGGQTISLLCTKALDKIPWFI